MAAGSLAPIPARLTSGVLAHDRLAIEAAKFSIDTVNHLKSLRARLSELEAEIDAVAASIPPLAATTPTSIEPDDAAAVGVSTQSARADHQHAIVAAAPSQGIGGGNTEGASAAFARADHDHALRETGGPTNLTLDSWPDQYSLRRIGAAAVGRLLEAERSTGNATTTSAALSDVQSGLNVVLPSSSAHVVVWVIFYSTASAITGGLFSVNFSGTDSGNTRYGVLMATGAATMHSQAAAAGVFDTALGNAAVGPGGTVRMALMFCRIGVTTGGTLALRYATGVAGNAVTVSANSFVLAVQE